MFKINEKDQSVEIVERYIIDNVKYIYDTDFPEKSELIKMSDEEAWEILKKAVNDREMSYYETTVGYFIKREIEQWLNYRD